MTTLVVSDLHLGAERPEKLDCFRAFCARARREADTLYILGDLFEVWVGDDDDTSPHPTVLDELARLSEAGVTLGVARGNRDFLLGDRFAQTTGARLLADYERIELNGRAALLTHGDLLCTDDVKYQRFRSVVRNRAIQKTFLTAPLAWRKRIAHRTQRGTRASTARKAPAIMDVVSGSVESVMRAQDVRLLIHGHTHRPAVHDFTLDGVPARRIVLGDWYEQENVLVCDDAGERLVELSDYLS